MTESSHGASTILAAGYAPLAPATRQAARATAGRFMAWFCVAFATSFALAWLYVATMPMAFLSRDYPLWIAKRTMLDECRLGSVAVFGDSRTLAATVPGVMPVAVSNFAMSGTSPIETYFSVQRALRCSTPPKLVVIAHGALKFTSDSDYWVFSARTGFLDYSQMRAVDADAARLHDSELQDLRKGDQLRPALRDFLFAARFPGFYFDSLVNGFVAARLHHNREALRDSLLSYGHALFGTAPGSSGIAAEAHGGSYAASPLVDLYFSRTLALLAKHGVPVILLSIPINHATYAQTSPRLGEQFSAYLQAKAKQYPGLHVVGPAIPCWPDEFFGDAWHFNARGADAYSRELGPWLRKVMDGGAIRDLPGRCGTRP